MKVLLAILAIVFSATTAGAETLRLAVTTSFQNSGLSDVLLPEIEADTGISVQLLVVGTGQAIRLGMAGDVDAILVHSRNAEDAFVDEGFGTHRREIMYNDFVVIGPNQDPAGVASADNAAKTLKRIHDTASLFVSRGDQSGTHKKELSLWNLNGANTETFGSWYRAVGAGMGAALNAASAMNAYVVADRASWINFGNKGELALLFEGDPLLFNQYAYLPVSKARHSHVKARLATRLERWLVSDKARTLIDGYRIDGQKMFTFNAER